MMDKDERILRAVALEMARRPRMNLHALAESVGISRTSLYRLAPTREKLVEVLKDHAISLTAKALDTAALHDSPPLEALKQVTRSFLDNGDVFAFWISSHWVDNWDAHHIPESEVLVRQRMTAFFLRGQKEGVFRVDLPARWLAQTHGFLVSAAIESLQRGSLAPTDACKFVMESFLQGAVSTD